MTDLWTPPAGAPEEDYARLPFDAAQAALAGGPVAGTRRRLACGWHGTTTDPERGSFAVVKAGGPNEDLVGERVRVQYGARSVLALVHTVADIAEDLSLARGVFVRLADLAEGELAVWVEAVA